MSLQQTYARLPITDEPIDGWFVVGAVLVILGVAGLVTGLLAPIVCGASAVAAVVSLQLSGRGTAAGAREENAPAAVSAADGAATATA